MFANAVKKFDYKGLGKNLLGTVGNYVKSIAPGVANRVLAGENVGAILKDEGVKGAKAAVDAALETAAKKIGKSDNNLAPAALEGIGRLKQKSDEIFGNKLGGMVGKGSNRVSKKKSREIIDSMLGKGMKYITE